MLNDIAACGADKEAVRHGTPHMSTELDGGLRLRPHRPAQPGELFGMVNVLEGRGTSIALATRPPASADKLQLPNKAFSYLNSHGSLGPGVHRILQEADEPTGQRR